MAVLLLILAAFAEKYLDVFSKGYNYAFGIAACTMVISLLVYLIFNKHLPNKEKKATEVSEKVDFKPLTLLAAIAAMGITAFALHFIKQVGWTAGFAFGLFAAFVTWIVLTAKKEEMSRITALILVFIVVIFFWMSFHQNGLTLTLFANEYSAKERQSVYIPVLQCILTAGSMRINSRTDTPSQKGS